MEYLYFGKYIYLCIYIYICYIFTDDLFERTLAGRARAKIRALPAPRSICRFKQVSGQKKKKRIKNICPEKFDQEN